MDKTQKDEASASSVGHSVATMSSASVLCFSPAFSSHCFLLSLQHVKTHRYPQGSAPTLEPLGAAGVPTSPKLLEEAPEL
ncbi:unnamed protein product [Lampetra planeri]